MNKNLLYKILKKTVKSRKKKRIIVYGDSPAII